MYSHIQQATRKKTTRRETKSSSYVLAIITIHTCTSIRGGTDYQNFGNCNSLEKSLYTMLHYPCGEHVSWHHHGANDQNAFARFITWNVTHSFTRIHTQSSTTALELTVMIIWGWSLLYSFALFFLLDLGIYILSLYLVYTKYFNINMNRLGAK